jgi:hypothetical protein
MGCSIYVYVYLDELHAPLRVAEGEVEEEADEGLAVLGGDQAGSISRWMMGGLDWMGGKGCE